MVRHVYPTAKGDLKDQGWRAQQYISMVKDLPWLIILGGRLTGLLSPYAAGSRTTMQDREDPVSAGKGGKSVGSWSKDGEEELTGSS